ncbi:hypothetical protein MACK_003452 [Theileria orientalis]|uniref:Uncharacterized protein n=1 Tax=Theileria orientalis TaxID=68886 RepID=A0A976SJ47_THEOR|nr:hypothetical protein MACK_003452 [Theileria orientalis]
MQFNLNNNVTLFLSVRKGLENCLLNEIKHNKLLNNICRIQKKREYIHNFEDTDTHSLPDPQSYLSSTELREENKNHGDKWIRLNHKDKSIAESTPETLNLNKSQSPASTHLRDSCNIYVQPGGLEVKCNLYWLLKCSLFVKSAESIWLRIGNPFRCHSEEQLVTFISKLPWSSYFPSNFIDTIPLRIISRFSKLWSSHTIDSCVRKGIRLSFEDDKKECNKFASVEDSCISLTLNRNTCYLAYQFSGRLSPRFYNFQFLDSERVDYSKYIPSWSLTGVKKKLLEKSRIEEDIDKTNRKTSSDSFDSKRKDYIKFQRFLTNDFSDTSDSLIAGFLREREVLRALTSKVESIWDPFCGNGLLICELMSMLLSLPNYVQDKSYPISSFFTQNLEEYKLKLLDYINISGPKKHLNIIGSDTSALNLTEANSKILKFFSFYKDILEKAEAVEGDNLINSTVFKSYSFFPLAIYNCSFEKLSHYMRNTLILTKIPYVDTKDRNRFETIKTYKQFGQVVSSKSDWKGVFVIARGRLFEYCSGLEWKKLVSSTNCKSEIKLLKLVCRFLNRVLGGLAGLGNSNLWMRSWIS